MTNSLTITGNSRIIAIIGDPISHSLSPVMQNAAFASGNLPYVYVPFAVRSESLGQAVAALRVLGVHGFNVTIPHKTAILPFLDELHDSAVYAGAANTVLFHDNKLIGYNTDGDGLVTSLKCDLDISPHNLDILILGAGGAARGAIDALCRNEVRRIIICNRTSENSQQIVHDFASRYADVIFDVISYNDLSSSQLSNVSLIINTTSIGMKGEVIPGLDLAVLPKNIKVYDMVYSRNAITPLLQSAHELNLSCCDGLGMLVGQGEKAFEIWTGQQPCEGAMRQALNIFCNRTTA